MALVAVADEIKPGVSAAIDHDPARVDALLKPKLGQRLAETVGADGGEIGRVRAEPRRRDHRVRGVAAEPLHEGRAVLRLIEFDQRFADRKEIRHALPRRYRHRDPGHQAAGGAIDKPHRPGRAQKSPRPIGGQRIKRQGRGDDDRAHKGELE